MNASSQTQSGAQPTEPRPLSGPAATFAAYGAVLPVPVGTTTVTRQAAPSITPDVPAHLVVAGLEPATPQCYACQGSGPWVPCPRGRRYSSGAQVMYCRACVPDSPVVEAASGVITAAMQHGHGSPQELAQAEEDAGLLFDPKRAQAIAAAAYQLGVDDTRADLGQTADEETLAWFRLRRQRVALLCEGRPDDHLLTVREVLTAADGRTPTDAPLSLTWTGAADIPGPGDAERRAVVHCTTAHGGRADLVVPDEQRLALASLLDAEVRDVTAPCVTSQACGTVDDLDASDPLLFGWSHLEIAGIEGGPRWYCTPHCVSNALARAGAELAAADDQAAIDGGL